VHIVSPDSIASVRASGSVATAIQSYPALLLGDGDVPFPLRSSGMGVNVHHRDARLAIGVMRDGRVLVALTRFEGLRGALSVLPFGFTTPEMAAVMGALGASRAVLLDGGISGQLRVRGRDGTAHEWDALRKVPLGLLVSAR
jgi:exopolysaccharide biosynthesis protein